ncbi:hypothetical protein AK812_SmicGene39893 [Symbiodinium microadriaticum]|uniref:Uncharacterized protein n=1 Tax=Symbiodinium microadriaticum TaxID=2951 RepID=A0A1Q9CA19_SYMMI|nr:hypothetical protein AK812_SmicGene39893 [Symbiodinium microadriaticum]
MPWPSSGTRGILAPAPSTPVHSLESATRMASMKSWTLCLFTALLLADGARIKRRRGTTVCPVNGGG